MKTVLKSRTNKTIFMTNKTKIFSLLFATAVFLSACVIDSDKKAASQVSENSSIAGQSLQAAPEETAKPEKLEESEKPAEAKEVLESEKPSETKDKGESSKSSEALALDGESLLPFHDMRHDSRILAKNKLHYNKTASIFARNQNQVNANENSLKSSAASQASSSSTSAEKISANDSLAEKSSLTENAPSASSSKSRMSESFDACKQPSKSPSALDTTLSDADKTLKRDSKSPLPYHNMRYAPTRDANGGRRTQSIFAGDSSQDSDVAPTTGVDAEKLAAEKAEAERLAAEEKARLEKEAAERAAAEKLAAEKAEAERLAAEEKARLERNAMLESQAAKRAAEEKAKAEAQRLKEEQYGKTPEERAAKLKAIRRAEAKLEEDEQESAALVRDEPLFLNIATFNMAFCCNEEHYAVWEKRKNLIKPLFHFHNLDICGSQEPYGFQIDYLAEQFPDYEYTGIVQGNDGPENFAARVPNAFHKMIVLKNMNNVIWYKKGKFEVLDSGRFWFSSTPNEPSGGFNEDRFDSERHCNWALFREKKSQKTFYVFNVHLQVNKGANDKEAVESIKLLLEKIEEIARGRTSFLMGDFNAKFNYDCMKLMEESPDMIDSRSITISAPFGPERTFFGFYGEHKNSKEPFIIDYIFVSPDVRILKHGVITDNDEGVYPSDHLPVLIRSEFR